MRTILDYFREHGHVRLSMEHVTEGTYNRDLCDGTLYGLRAGGVPMGYLTINDLRDLQALLGEHMAAVEAHNAAYRKLPVGSTNQR